MSLLVVHLRTNVVETLRQPIAWIFSVSFPFVLFLFFGMTNARQVTEQTRGAVGGEAILTPFLLFGVLSVVLFQFGVGLAEERRLPWERTLRVLPAPEVVRFAGRVGTALFFSVLAMVPVSILAVATTDVRLDAAAWALLVLATLAGAIPFGLAGIGLGYATSPKAALPIANIGYLVLSFMGGLFVPLDFMPNFVQEIGTYLPTRHYHQFVGGLVSGYPQGGWQLPGLYLVGWTLLFGALAAWAYRHNEGVRYR
ncbi:MAG: ABC transporter permease [Streptosporangiales bacterium]|nr:ABC transporter permease [Streptosporangiales bacterium]